TNLRPHAEFLTPRLAVRTPLPSDADYLVRAVQSDPQGLEALSQAQAGPFGPGLAASRIRQFRDECASGASYRFFVFPRPETDMRRELVGQLSLSRIDHAQSTAEVGYWILSTVRRRGLGLEALRGLLAWAQVTLKLDKFDLRCEAQNWASRALAEAAGFSLAEELPWARIAPGDGKMQSICRYSLDLTEK